MKIEFYFDPSCPWCWITSRWISEVAPKRDVDVTWKSFSLAIKNDPDGTGNYKDGHSWGHRGLRVIEAVREDGGNDAVDRLYTALGARRHNDGDRNADIGDALEEAGLDRSFASAADDGSWDDVIRGSMKGALDLAGDDVGVPTIVYEGESAYFGPVMTPAPTGEAALTLWDSLAALAVQTEGFYELKRTREHGPEFGERPTV